MPTNEVKEAALEFVIQYLDREIEYLDVAEIEYLDVAEFLYDWNSDMDEAGLAGEVHAEVTRYVAEASSYWLSGD